MSEIQPFGFKNGCNLLFISAILLLFLKSNLEILHEYSNIAEISGKFVVKVYSKAYSVKSSKGQQVATVFTASNFRLDGYRILGIIEYNTGSNQVYPYRLNTDMVQVSTPLGNEYGFGVTYSGTMSVKILYVKS